MLRVIIAVFMSAVMVSSTLAEKAQLAEQASAIPYGDLSLALGESRERSVRDFLRPNGQLDLEVVRSSGYQGPLDLKGFDVRIDQKSGQPITRQSPPHALGDHEDDIYWTAMSELAGIDGPVHALAVYDGLLIADGDILGLMQQLGMELKPKEKEK